VDAVTDTHHTSTLHRKAVLVVEDDPLNAKCFMSMLHSCGGEFSAAGVDTLTGGLKRLHTETFDAILLDLHLPDSSGIATFNRMRDLAKATPIVVLTGNDDAATAMAAMRGGAQDYLIKGDVTAGMLVRAVRYAVERGRLLTELREAYDRIQTLRGLIPICSRCKKIRDDGGYWQEVEQYVGSRSEALFSHSYCPECSDAELARLEVELDEMEAGRAEK
jgi:DNA-binding NtrC family response regulator